MTPALRQKVLYGLLGLAVLWGVYNFDTPKKRAGEAGQSVAAGTATAGTAGAAAKPSIPLAEYEKRPWGDDPFRVQRRAEGSAGSVGSAQATGIEWTLTGIVYSDTQPLAIINSRMVGIGDRVDGATVIEINKRQVVLERGSDRFTLQVASRG